MTAPRGLNLHPIHAFWRYFIEDSASVVAPLERDMERAFEVLQLGVDEHSGDAAALCFLQLHFVAALHGLRLPEDDESVDALLFDLFKRYSFESETILTLFYMFLSAPDTSTTDPPPPPPILGRIVVPEGISENRFSGTDILLFGPPVDSGGGGVAADKRPAVLRRQPLLVSSVLSAVEAYLNTPRKDLTAGYLPIERRSRQVKPAAFATECILPGDLRHELLNRYFV